MHAIVYSDLDGSFLDHRDYDFTAALPTFRRLKTLGIPCVWNTSKTLPELLRFREALNPDDPFIIENGAAIYLPLPEWERLRGPFPGAGRLPEAERIPNREDLAASLQTRQRFLLQTFGPERTTILNLLAPLRARYRFTGFADLSLAELQRRTGLGDVEAQWAAERAFTEPLVWLDSDDRLRAFQEELEEAQLQCVRGGRFLHVSGRHDKGEALRWLQARYATAGGQSPLSIALGDGENDRAMLEAADIGIVIPPFSGPPLRLQRRDGVHLAEHPGPTGWASRLDAVLDQLTATHHHD